jgi:hypothetical protein
MTDSTDPAILDNSPRYIKMVRVLRDHYSQQHQHIIDDARAEHRRAVAREFCATFDVAYECHASDECGSLTLRFPAGRGWTVDRAETFAAEVLDLDLRSRAGGPGRAFRHYSTGPTKDGGIGIYLSQGLDI